MVGLSSPTTGQVDRPAHIGYVPERFPTHQRMSAWAYLTHMGRIRGMETRAAATRARDLLDRLALVGGADASLRRLSKGNAQKVALAQALMVPPDLLVLDEPWSGLDVSAHEILANLIDEVAVADGTVVFTDHRDAIVRANAATIYRLADGGLRPVRGAAGGALLAVAEVELRAPWRRPPADVDWSRFPGLLGMVRHLDTMALTVVGERCDELLVTAIRAGWSVGSVRRDTRSATGGPGGQRT